MPVHSVFWVAWDFNGVSRNTNSFDIQVRLIHFLGHPDGEGVSCLELSLTYYLLILIDTCSLAILYNYVDCPKNPDTQLVRRFGGCCLVLLPLAVVHTQSQDPSPRVVQTVVTVSENRALVFGRRKDTAWLWMLHSIRMIEVQHRLRLVPRRTCSLDDQRMVRNSMVADSAKQYNNGSVVSA
jgi:hypothetical protein